MYREFQDSREGFDATSEAEYNASLDDFCMSMYEEDEDDYECDEDPSFDGQPDEYTEWQDYMGGDDWDHGQFDEGY